MRRGLARPDRDPQGGRHGLRPAGRRGIAAGRLTERAAAYGILGSVGLLFVSPFYWALIASFKTPAEARAIPPTWFPRTFTLDAYAQVLNWEFARYFLNSFIYATSLTVLIAFTSSIIAFTVVKLPSRAGNTLFALIVGSMMVPFATYIVPLYGQLLYVQRTLGVPMVNTYWGMILPEMISPFGVFLLRQAILSVPGELLDAARIDGAGRWARVRYITIPLVMPTIAFVTIIMTLSSLMMFTETFVMTDSTGHGGYAQPIGGPNYATHTVVYNIYNQAFDRHREGYASAIAAVFFCVMVLIGAAQFRYLRAKFEY